MNALRDSLPVGNKFFTANVKGGQHTVSVFCSTLPDMEKVVQTVTGANNTATVTCKENQGQWEVTVTWVEPDTSKDEAIARALQEKENACGRGGAGRGAGANGRGGSGRGGAGRGGGGGVGTMWTEEQRLKYEQEEADYKFAMQLQVDNEGHGVENVDPAIIAIRNLPF